MIEAEHTVLLKFLAHIELIYSKLQGVKCRRVARGIASVGLYVPGGTAVLPSTALMLSVVCRSNPVHLLLLCVTCVSY